MKEAPTTFRLLPVCVIGLVTLLLSFTSAAATTLAVKSSAHVVKAPPQAGAAPKGKDKPKDSDKPKGSDKQTADPEPNGADNQTSDDKPKGKDKAKVEARNKAESKSKADAGDKSDPADGGGAKPVQVQDQSPPSATAVIPVEPPAAVQPTVTVGATTGSGRGETQATKGAGRRSASRSKRKKRRASAGSTQRPLSAPLATAAAAPIVRAAKTTIRARKPERRRPARRSVVERIVDRVPAAYRFGLLAAIAVAAGFAFATFRQRRRARRAEAEALVDALTGLANRRAFDRRLAEEWKRSERYGRPLGLVILDLDGFKQLNDTRGHKEGDRVLRQTASLLNERLREIDMAARLGGDEFAALCPETPNEGLDALRQSLQQCLEGLPVGASIGYAEREPTDDNPLDLLERADAAMYQEKRLEPAAR
jgi:diguanylate cyclase (GGDEF)-like protein